MELTAGMCVEIVSHVFGKEEPEMIESFLKVIKPYFRKKQIKEKQSRVTKDIIKRKYKEDPSKRY